ncbi:MAG: stage V sporulation protein AC [Firmicutes bacterium]|nr:stage V sporulation protein AC [Dethiobacter sp.]MBS3889339.1 stage V sporulation protein AC [Bacillota bacterium]MBS4055022.1 stage V sporulation protein AC [Thermaerobacter sp.]
MVGSKARKKQLQRKDYQQLSAQKRLKIPVWRNTLVAFVVGGLVSVLGQGLIFFYIWLGFKEEQAASPMVATLILIASILTGLGVWDYLGQFAGAGVGVPVTGFANSIVSSAIEFKREGYILGVGGRMFQLAGPVIVYGAVTAFVVGLIHALVQWL